MSSYPNTILNQWMTSNGFLWTRVRSAQSPSTPNSPSGGVVEVALTKEGGTFKVPLILNGVIPLSFTVDSGAADVTIPADVVMTLIRTGTLKSTDFTGIQNYKLADGTVVPSKVFIIHTIRVGNRDVTNVTASMTGVEGSLLLGQSFLSRFRRISFDYGQQLLILE